MSRLPHPADLARLKGLGLANLSLRDLESCKVTDFGLLHLRGLTNLSELELHGTLVTDAGVQELPQALPSLKITR